MSGWDGCCGNGFPRLFHFRDIGAFISFRGFIVSFVVLTLAAGLANLAFRLGQRVLVVAARHSRLDATSLTAGILFYRRLVQMLAAYDLEPQSGGDPERVRAPRPQVLDRPGTAHPTGRRRPPRGRRRVLSSSIRASRARTRFARGARCATRRPRNQLEKPVNRRGQVA